MCKLLCWFKAKCVISASLTDIAKIVFLFYVKCVVGGYEFILFSRKFAFVVCCSLGIFPTYSRQFYESLPYSTYMHSIQWKFGWNSKNFGTYRNEERSPVLAIMPITCIWISYWHFLSIDTATMMGNFRLRFSRNIFSQIWSVKKMEIIQLKPLIFRDSQCRFCANLGWKMNICLRDSKNY